MLNRAFFSTVKLVLWSWLPTLLMLVSGLCTPHNVHRSKKIIAPQDNSQRQTILEYHPIQMLIVQCLVFEPTTTINSVIQLYVSIANSSSSLLVDITAYLSVYCIVDNAAATLYSMHCSTKPKFYLEHFTTSAFCSMICRKSQHDHNLTKMASKNIFGKLYETMRYFHNTHSEHLLSMQEQCKRAKTTADLHHLASDIHSFCYYLHNHHTIEDQHLFPKLAAKIDISHLEAHHEQLAQLLNEFDSFS
ncbi:unnamed protein product, partial [Adineta ricciae]